MDVHVAILPADEFERFRDLHSEAARRHAADFVWHELLEGPTKWTEVDLERTAEGVKCWYVPR